LAQAGLIDKLFERFGQHLEAEGYIARGGQIIDATIVSVPKQRNTKEENGLCSSCLPITSLGRDRPRRFLLPMTALRVTPISRAIWPHESPDWR
jgi:hypothetical protein